MWQPWGMAKEILRLNVDGAEWVLRTVTREEMTPEERAARDAANADIKAGRTMSSEEMLAKIRALPLEHVHAAE